MSKLSISLAAISGNGYTIDEVVPVEELCPENAKGLDTASVSVRGTLRKIGDEYVFRAQLACEYRRVCDRCLEPAVVPFDTNVAWSYRLAETPEAIAAEDAALAGGEQGTAFAFCGNEIDLGVQVWEELVLAAPAKCLCREDCAGLCSHCGANLNDGACTCRADGHMDNKGLAGLADLLPDLEAKPPEE
ncbi:MAG: hypothetical protein GWP08_21645 [Nitrospiraceae bacterium]|nr:hypothetical protein [Nitrospiraceae bacterium]